MMRLHQHVITTCLLLYLTVHLPVVSDAALPDLSCSVGCPVSHESSGRPREARRRRGVKKNIHLQR